MSKDLERGDWRVEREMLTDTLAASNSRWLDVPLLHFPHGLVLPLFRFLLIPLSASLYFLCVFPSCRHLFPGSGGNQCARFQRLILPLRTGEPNM